MFPAPPAIIRPFDADQYVPTAADLEEQSLADAVAHPDVRNLFTAACEVMQSNAAGGSMVYLAQCLMPFVEYAATKRPAPLRLLPMEPPPF